MWVGGALCECLTQETQWPATAPTPWGEKHCVSVSPKKHSAQATAPTPHEGGGERKGGALCESVSPKKHSDQATAQTQT